MAIRRNTHTLVGEIKDYSGGSVEFGFLLTDGASYPTATYPKLFAKIGYTYGGAGPNFNVPDWRGRVSAGKDDMGGTPANRLTSGGSGINGTTLGASGGAETHSLSSAENGAHSHGGGTGGESNGHQHEMSGDFWGTWGTGSTTTFGWNTGFIVQTARLTNSNSAGHNHSIPSDGSGTAHQNTQPTMVALKMIAYL